MSEGFSNVFQLMLAGKAVLKLSRKVRIRHRLAGAELHLFRVVHVAHNQNLWTVIRHIRVFYRLAAAVMATFTTTAVTITVAKQVSVQ
ncbi:hypothetical protein DNH77_25620 [Salmonella enterica subsp. enterica]|nr:hypothetical protein [Salmonella enterica subsp. enterica serovar Minnesota]